MAGKSLVPRNSGEGGIGKSNVWWGSGYFNNIYCDTGYFGDQLLVSGRDVMEIIDTTVEQKIEEVGGGPRWERAETEGNIYFPNNVGINNPNPSEKLDVSGNVLVSNNLTVTNLLSGRSISTQDLSISGTGFNSVAKDLSLEVLQPGSNVFLDKDPIRRTLKIHTLHEPIQSSESSINQGRTYIQSIELDQHGHVIDLISGTETGIDTQRTDDEIKDIGTGLIKEGANVTIDKNTNDKTLTINSHHPLIPRAQESSDNSGRDYIQNIKFDEYGHVTGLEIGTETITSSQVLSNIQAGDNVRILENNNDGIDIFSDHPATENVAGSTHNLFESRLYIKDIKLDEFGHVTGISSEAETITVSDLSDYVTNKLVAGDNIDLNNHREFVDHDSAFNFTSIDDNSDFLYVGEGNAWQDPIDGFFVDFGDGNGHDTFVLDGESGLSINYESASVTISQNSPLVNNGVPPVSLSGQYTSYIETDRVSISSSHVIVNNVPPSSNNQNRTYIQNIDLDQFGHVNGLSVGTESFVPRTDSEILDLCLGLLQDGDNISISKDFVNGEATISSHHIDIPDAADDSNNSGTTYIQNISLDSYGHVTNIATSSERTDSQIVSAISSSLVEGENVSIDTSTANEIKLNYNLTSVLDEIYPIGSIYISASSTDPQSLFGGIWVSFGQGRCLVGLDSNDTDFNTTEAIGGEKNVALTKDQLPSHHHGFTPEYIANGNAHRGELSPSSFSIDSPTTSSAGGNQAHNNMQPYIVVSMWKRTG